MALNLQKLPKISLSRLQALLLLGGAFVLGVLLWFGIRYRLIWDRNPEAPPSSVFAVSLVNKDGAFLESQEWKRFLAFLPLDANGGFGELAASKRPATLFLEAGAPKGGGWGLLMDTSGTWRWPRMRLLKRSIDAVGFIVMNGRRQPFTASFKADHVEMTVGRGYRGPSFLLNPFSGGRRVITPISQSLAYLEKPEGVSWDPFATDFGQHLQRFRSLAIPWTWPGRIELSVSASSTGASLYPFVLYYHPMVGELHHAEKMEDFASALLAETSPQAIQVTLPDLSSMTEYRSDRGAVQVQTYKNSFGKLLHLSMPGSKQKFSLFEAKIGESWLSNDTNLIQTALLSNLSSTVSSRGCENKGYAGYSSFSGRLFPAFEGFKEIDVSVQDREAGMFIICGYY